MAGAASADEPVLRTERRPWGVRIIMDRPAKLNALDSRLVAALIAALDAAEADDEVRVIALSGAGRAFCALNLLNGLVIGLLAGLTFRAGSFLKRHIERLLARGQSVQIHHSLLAGLSVCALFAIVFNQQWHIYRFAIALIREGEKIESLNQPLLNHERSTSYLIVFGLVIFFFLPEMVHARVCQIPLAVENGLCLALCSGHRLGPITLIHAWKYSYTILSCTT